MPIGCVQRYNAFDMPTAGRLHAFWIATFLSGAAGLALQVAWQRWLAVLVGSQSRSVSLVVGVFLFGLASGYRAWGAWAERLGSRREILRAYGLVEFAIGLYAISFPWLFRAAQAAAVQLPDSFAVDLLLTLALLFVPTFLMGATVPLLTKALPSEAGQVNDCHARVYGINTLGAFLGTFVAGFWLVPWYGLSRTLLIAGCADLLVGAVFFFNRQQGALAAGYAASEGTKVLKPLVVYTLALVCGAASIALEVLVVRILSLGVGLAFFVFPVVLGVFVLGLALGSLSLGRSAQATVSRIGRELAGASCALFVVYLCVPYWPAWLLRIRSWAQGLSPRYAYVAYLGGLVAFCAVFLLPALIHLGRVLPLAFAALEKPRDDYGRVSGRLYFCNTLGTAAGSILLGYFAFHWLNLDGVFKLTVAVLGIGSAVLARSAARAYWPKVAVAFALAVCVWPAWDRASYHIGLFHGTAPASLEKAGFFHKPSHLLGGDLRFLKDGPDGTVTVVEFLRRRAQQASQSIISRSLIVNGKSDGNTVGDYSTMALVATIPYLHANKESGLEVAVVGFGTGITAGLAGRMKDVERVEVIEISRTVLEAGRYFEVHNHNALDNPKIKTIESDAFRYFSRGSKKFDLLISEPSNPWVVGVENLYTPEFYALARSSLAEGGIFVQWMHTYNLNGQTLYAMLESLGRSFSYLKAFHVSGGDVAILASQEPLGQRAHYSRRFNEPFVRSANFKAGVTSESELKLIELFDERYLRWLGSLGPRLGHSLDRPRLSLFAGEARFFAQSIPFEDLMPNDTARELYLDRDKARAFEQLALRYPEGLPQCLAGELVSAAFCDYFGRNQKALRVLRDQARAPEHEGWQWLMAYQQLRRQGLIAADLDSLERIRRRLVASRGDATMKREVAVLLIRELANDAQWHVARSANAEFSSEKIISNEISRTLENDIASRIRDFAVARSQVAN